MHGEITVEINAPIDVVWELITDVTRIGEFSPETFEAEWLSDPPRPAVGARFRGHVRRNGRGPVYWTDCRVSICDPPHEFAFDVHVGERLVNTWRYRLQPRHDHRVAVTESFHLAPSPATRLYWRVAGRWRSRTNQRGMLQTLHRIKAVAEDTPRPPERPVRRTHG